MKNEAFSTVYIMPGTYNEATTLTVSSSMDIIGLGDKDAVKIIKIGADYTGNGVVYSSKNAGPTSNRHLFDCSGTKEEYIHVTLRNLYLDASAWINYKYKSGKLTLTASVDNGAVQSIRKSMVKCYDLTIVNDANNMGSYSFYVNAKYANGDPAYLYAENIVTNSKKSVAIVDFSTETGVAYFYYDNIAFNNGTEQFTTENNTSYTIIENQYMAPDDWTWD